MTKEIDPEGDQQVFWLVGRWDDQRDEPWHFQGLFATEEEAVAACRTPKYFIGPVTLGASLPHEKVAWPGMYYPLAKAT